jgi:hypothetical protein
MDGFDSEPGTQAPVGRHAEDVRRLPHQQRSQPLAAIQAAMPHGRNQTVRRHARAAQAIGGQQGVQGPLDIGGAAGHFVGKGDHGRKC